MNRLNLSPLDKEIKKDLAEEIVEANNFLAWMNERIEARSLDKDKGILNILIDLRKNQEEYINVINQEWFEKYS